MGTSLMRVRVDQVGSGREWSEGKAIRMLSPQSSDVSDIFSELGVALLAYGERSYSKSEMASPGSTLVDGGSSLGSLVDGEAEALAMLENGLNTKCPVCNEMYTQPKVLACFHSFCQPCLEKQLESSDKITCPLCQQECALSSSGVAGLPSDYAISNVLESSAMEGSALHCTGCKSKESNAVARCFDCANFLCPNCVMAHQFMHCFEGHRVLTLGELQNNKDELRVEKPVSCPRHKNELLKYFCRTCNLPVCKECTVIEHVKGMHDYEYLSDVGPKQVEHVAQLVDDGRAKSGDLRAMLKGVEHTSNRLQVQYHKAQNEINETFQFYRSMIDERKQEALKELESVYTAKQLSINVLGQKVQEAIDKIFHTCEFVDRLTKYATNTEVLMFKKLLDAKFHTVLAYSPETNLQNVYDIEFVSNYQAIQVGVRNTFGYIRSSSEMPSSATKSSSTSSSGPGSGSDTTTNAASCNSNNHNGQGIVIKPQPQPIARPTNGSHGHGHGHGHSHGGTNSSSSSSHSSNGVIERPYQNGHVTSFESNMLSKRFSSTNSLGPFSTGLGDLSPYDKWSGGGGDVSGGGNGGNGGNGGGNGNGNSNSIFQNGVGGGDHYPLTNDPVIDLSLSSKLITANISIFPPKSQIKRQKMIYHCKFGEFGVMEGQFTEPSGVAVNAQNDIIVADTNNHRIQIFDKEGRFKFQFGECGKRDGQLLYPNRVAVVKTSGDIIVTERSPTHQIQIYNQYGQFVRKFGANILQHPRGVTVDNKGRIIVVECKVMRVIIFDQVGNVLQKFGCSKHLEFPNGVVVNDKQEIFISDNRAHCVKVFNYEGIYLRQIGGEGITNYPIGVGINQAGEILIADNHNNFNLTIFTQDGQLVSALESKVKHAQCFDVALMDDGSVVLASKDYRLYIYRYIQIPSMGL